MLVRTPEQLIIVLIGIAVILTIVIIIKSYKDGRQ